MQLCYQLLRKCLLIAEVRGDINVLLLGDPAKSKVSASWFSMIQPFIPFSYNFIMLIADIEIRNLVNFHIMRR